MNPSQNKNPLVVILGSTATGKTELGLKLAKKFNGEIVSADSRQIYKDLDIGSGRGKPDQVGVKVLDGVWYQEAVPIYLYDQISPSNQITVMEFKNLAEEAIDTIRTKHNLPIVVGGTGFYISALLNDIPLDNIPPDPEFRSWAETQLTTVLAQQLVEKDPDLAEKTDLKNPRRIIRALERANYVGEFKNEVQPTEALQIGITAPLEVLEERIKKRTERMIEEGFLEEARRLLQIYGPSAPGLSAIGYHQIQAYLNGDMSLEEAIEIKVRDELNYAKRQMTWFKRDPRIEWFEIPVFDQEIFKKVESYLKVEK